MGLLFIILSPTPDIKQPKQVVNVEYRSEASKQTLKIQRKNNQPVLDGRENNTDMATTE